MPRKPSVRNHRFNVLSAALTAALIITLSGCVTIYNPATERTETLLIDTQSEISLGINIDKQVRKELKVLNDKEIKNRLERIGRKVAASSDRQDIAYKFEVVDDKEMNAFAVPGGFIYVNKGLMDEATDDELACVVAHEVGHIAARHSVKQIQATLGYQIIANIALGGSGQSSILQATDIVFSLVNLGYSRQDEFLADKLAVKYAKRSGFDAQAMISFFGKLQKESEKSGASLKPVFLSSHPPIKDRIENIKAQIALYK